ncbi:hypothetical protein GQ42DRAFT_165036 [Ramicandelaber brevisporus]|nr:hypothetical protein GQ42DRAFT_165036 [Ramicandelaber brevisporus]
MPKRALDESNLKSEISVPFPLVSLPYELLEEIAAWFTQREAVKVLPVSKTLSEAFSRAVWRRVVIRDSLLRLPADVWRRYGHLVRFANVVSTKETSQAIWMPNVNHLILHFGSPSRRILSNELHSLRNLKIVFTSIDDWNEHDAIWVAAWANNVDTRNQRVIVHWDIQCSCPQHYTVLDNILTTIVNAEQHSFTLRVGVDEFEPINQLAKLVPRLVALEVKYIYDHLFFFNQCSYFFGDSNISYPRLQSLSLSQHLSADGHGAYNFNYFSPSRFPAIRHFDIRLYYAYSFDDIGSIFEHCWLTVKELSITYCQGIDVLERILGQFPTADQLTFCYIDCPIDLQMIAKYLPKLQLLNLRDIYNELSFTPSPQLQLRWLQEFKMHNYRWKKVWKLPSSVLSFILMATPRLRKLDLSACSFSESTLDEITTCLSTSVRVLVVDLSRDGFSETELAKLVALLPNMRWLKLRGSDEQTRLKLQNQYPQFIVELVYSTCDNVDVDNEDDNEEEDN